MFACDIRARADIAGTRLIPGSPLLIAVANLNSVVPSQFVVGASSGNYTTQLQNGVPSEGVYARVLVLV